MKLARRSHCRDLTDCNAATADAAAKAIARQIADRLRQYPVFGPARPQWDGHAAEGPDTLSRDHSCAGEQIVTLWCAVVNSMPGCS